MVRHDPPTTNRVVTPPSNDDDPALRRNHGGGTTPPPPHTDPTPKKNGVSGVDGPVDPYGGGEASDADSPQKKAEFYAGVGQSQLGNGDTAAAAASFKKAAELDPSNATAVIGLGEIALRQGLFGDAIMHLNRAAKLAPKNSKVFTLLGYAYLNAGQNKQAADNFKKALQIDPDNAQARDGFNEASSRVPPPTEENSTSVSSSWSSRPSQVGSTRWGRRGAPPRGAGDGERTRPRARAWDGPCRAACSSLVATRSGGQLM